MNAASDPGGIGSGSGYAERGRRALYVRSTHVTACVLRRLVGYLSGVSAVHFVPCMLCECLNDPGRFHAIREERNLEAVSEIHETTLE